MTTILNFYGGPGTGKSTSAALAFATLKQGGVNAEITLEYAKELTWAGQKITTLRQFELFGEQSLRLVRLLGQVEVIVTDSPLLLGEFFARWYGSEPVADALKHARTAFEFEAGLAGHTQMHVHLRRTKPFNPKGRNESEETARAMDGAQRDLAIEQYGGNAVHHLGTDEAFLRTWVQMFVAGGRS